MCAKLEKLEVTLESVEADKEFAAHNRTSTGLHRAAADASVGPRPRWQIGVVLAMGLGISFAAFLAISHFEERDFRERRAALQASGSMDTPARPGYWRAWCVLALGSALSASIALHLFSARRRAAQIRELIETLSREFQEHFESEERYRLLVENAPDAIVSLDVEGNLRSGNPYSKNITGWSSEWRGRQCWPLVHADDQPAAREAFDGALQGRKPPVIEIRVLNKSGEFIPMEFTVTPHFHDQRVNGVLVIGRDVFARRKAEQAQASLETQLRRAQKMEALGRLAGGIAHEFNNFLAIIMVNTELTRMNLGPDHSAVESLDQTAKASQRAADLVRQVLNFSHNREQERFLLKLEPVLKDAVKMLRATLPASIEIHLNIAPECPPVMAEPGQVHQVLLNLATNSAHAMRNKPGRLEVSLSPVQVDEEFAARILDLRVGRYVCLTVSDNGHGMDSCTLERIFEPFFTTKSPGEGTGLGLSVVHGIVKAHGGAISIYSDVGRGTTFRIYLPAAGGEVQPKAAEPAEAPRGNGERILLVDDEVSIAHCSRHVLERLGYHSTACGSPTAALDLLRTSPVAFDCIISDLSMPGMSGIELAQESRRLKPGTPVILMSGHGGALTAGALRSEGIHDLLLKPFTPRILGETLHRVLHSNQQKLALDHATNSCR